MKLRLLLISVGLLALCALATAKESGSPLVPSRLSLGGTPALTLYSAEPVAPVQSSDPIPADGKFSFQALMNVKSGEVSYGGAMILGKLSRPFGMKTDWLIWGFAGVTSSNAGSGAVLVVAPFRFAANLDVYAGLGAIVSAGRPVGFAITAGFTFARF